MAIIFNKQLTEDRLYLAYNNNVIEFYANSAFQVANAVITIDTLPITIYPGPSGLFTYNFKEIMTTILNANNFKDNLNPDIETSFIYDWTDKVSLITDFGIDINFTNETSESSVDLSINWLSGFVNLRDWKISYPNENLLTGNIRVLQKETQGDYYKYKLKYWEGYPFDITLFLNSTPLNILNENNSLDYDFLSTDRVSRLVFSDGRTDISIEDLIPLQNGYNNLNFNTDFNLQLNKSTDFCSGGIYIKWINSLGGWNYWYFSKGNEETKTKSNGSLFNDYFDLEDTISPLVSLGKTSDNTISIQERNINKDYKLLLTDLLDSPKVYLFTGVPFSKNTFNDWMEVNLSDGAFRTENSRTDLYTFNFKLELPPNITRTL